MSNLEARTQKIAGIRQITGNELFNNNDLLTLEREISPLILAEKRANIQALEIMNISQDADALLGEFKHKHLPPPSAFGVFTTGHVAGENAIKIGELGKGLFQNYAGPETKGHKGEVYMIPFGNNHYMLGFFGRAHPNEYFGNEYGPIIVAHQLRVVKELIRIERAELGIDPPIFMSYLAGASEGHFLQKGQAGIILSDTEFSNIIHPGHGPVAILDEYIGNHFQSKYIPTSDLELSKFFIDKSSKEGLVVKPVAAAGTFGTPEFQNPEEYDMWKFWVERSRSGQTGEWAKELFLNGNEELTAAFDMGITFEQAVLRQRFLPYEVPVKKIAVILTSDIVGETGSTKVSHIGNVAEAEETAPKFQNALFSALKKYVESKNFFLRNYPNYSIRAKLVNL